MKLFTKKPVIFKSHISKKKFTLIEILLVCALLAFIMAMSVGAYKIIMEKSVKSKCVGMIKQIEVAFEAYKTEMGFYPQQKDGGTLYIRSTDTELIKLLPDYDKWKSEEYITWKDELVDPYNVKFWYRCPGYHNRTGFDIESAGPDKHFGYIKTSGHAMGFEQQMVKDKDTSFAGNKIHDSSNIYYPDKQKDNIKNWVD